MKAKIGAWCVIGCVAVLGACAGTVDPDVDGEEQELVDRTPDGSAHLFGEAERMIAKGDIEGAERACLLSKDALSKEALDEDEAASAQARTAFCFAEVERLSWELIALDSEDMSEIKAQLETKVAGHRKLAERYQQVMEMGSQEWTLASATRVGDIFVHFADSILASTVPPALAEDQRVIYREQLEQLADPLYREAGTRYAKVLAKAEEDGVEGTYVDHARSMSKQYP